MNLKRVAVFLLVIIPSFIVSGKIKMPDAHAIGTQLEQYVNSSSEFEQVKHYLINQLADKELEIEVINKIVNKALDAYDDRHSNDLADHQLAIMCQEDGVKQWLHDFLDKNKIISQ